MEEIKYNGTDEIVYHERLDNGMDVYMYPIKSAKNFYITLNVKYGSVIDEFKLEGDKKSIIIPHGTAHFLEHQLFQEEDGHTAFENFAKLGSSVNAFTTYDLTCYEVVASENFKENLNTLLDFVQNPIFKAGSIQKEKGIIKEEIKMYDNMPGAVLNFGLEYNLNIKDNHKYLISGTEEDIKNIDSDILYKVYDAFYNPNNMFMVITGNFKAHEALGIIKSNQTNKEFGEERKIITKITKEPIKVFNDYEKRIMNVSMPKLKIAYKISKEDFKEYDKTTLKIYLDAILYLKFGPSSDLGEKLLSENLSNWDISFSSDIRENYIAIFIEISSEYVEEVIKLVEEEIENLNITKDEINRIKKINISNFVFHFNDLISVCESIQDDIISNETIVKDIKNIYENLNEKEANKIASLINIENSSIFIIDKE